MLQFGVSHMVYGQVSLEVSIAVKYNIEGGRIQELCYCCPQVRDKLQIAWVNEEDPSKGMKYMYLSDDDYHRVGKSVKAELHVTRTGQRRWIVQDVVGAEDGLGVENLSGSAAIGTLFCRWV